MDLIIIISRRVMQCLLLSDTRFNNFIVRQKERPPRTGREKIASEKGCQSWLTIHDQKKEPDKYSELPNKNPPRPSTTIILAILTIGHPLHRERVPRNNKTVNFHFAYLTTIPSSLLYMYNQCLLSTWPKRILSTNARCGGLVIIIAFIQSR